MDILARIGQTKGILPKKQRIVAEFMEQNPEMIAYITLKELSERIKVTEVTILNTCQSLGFDGYSNIKYEFRKNLIEKNKMDVLSEKEAYTAQVPEYESTDSIQFLKEVGKEEIGMLQKFWDTLDLEKIVYAARMIRESSKTFVCGRGASYFIARSLVDRMYSCEYYAGIINTELNEEVYGILQEFQPETLLIAISFPDYYFMTVKLAQFAREKGTKILAITDDTRAEITQYADFVLTVPSLTRAFQNTLSAPMFLVNLICSAMKVDMNNEKTDGKDKLLGILS